MSPERRARIIQALGVVWGELVLCTPFEEMTDVELLTLVATLEEMLEGAGGTDVDVKSEPEKT